MEKKELKKKMEKELIEMNMAQEKETLRRNIKVLVKYDFVETAAVGVAFKEMFDKLLLERLTSMESCKLSKKQKQKLHLKYHILFGDKEDNIQQANLRYYKSLVKWSKHRLKDLNKDLKEQIVMGSIENMQLWDHQFDINSKLCKEIEKLEKQVKPKKKKKLKRKPHISKRR